MQVLVRLLSQGAGDTRKLARSCACIGLESVCSPVPFSVRTGEVGDSVTMALNAQRARHGEALSRRKDFWERWSTRVPVVAMLVFAIIAVALMTDPGNEPWYHKTFEVIQHIIMQARPGGVGPQ